MEGSNVSVFNRYGLALGFALSIFAQENTPPTLRSRIADAGQVEISWSAQGAPWVLESAVSIQPPVSWRPTLQTPSQAGDQFSVMLAVAERAQFFRLRGSGAVEIYETSPGDGETGVAVTRETILRFSAPLSAETVLATDQFEARFNNRRLLSRAELSMDRSTATLFYLEQLPASARIQVTLDGTGISDASGKPLDLDGDGLPGGVFGLSFSTSATAGAENTAIMGHVFAAEKGTNGANVPLEGAIVSVDGAEETLRARTDAAGFFLLQPAPVGRFFVHVDGRTAKGSDWPRGSYYPFVGKAWETIPGKTNNLANGNGVVFLPLIPGEALTTVSATQETRITFAPSVSATNPALAGVSITVPANSLFSENGARGGKVGIAAVPPDRLPEPLPAGLDLPLVITIQTDGPMNFDRPVPVRFPNLPDPVTGLKLPPGAKTVLWSFNHDTGRWEPQGTATITPDGNFAETDPGVGVRQPGWHGVAPGNIGFGPVGSGGKGPYCEHWGPVCCLGGEAIKKTCDPKLTSALTSLFDYAVDLPIAFAGLSPLLNCGVGTAGSTVRAARDCAKAGQFSADCGTTVQDGTIGAAAGCFPGPVGTVAGLAWSTKGVIKNTFEYKECLDTAFAACGFGGRPQSTLNETSERQSAGGVRAAAAFSGDPRLLRAAAALELQLRVGTDGSNAVVRILGNPIWASVESPEMLQTYSHFMDALQSGLDAGSPGGGLLGVSERASILSLPRPNGASLAEATALLNRLEGFGHDLLKTNLVVRAEVAEGYGILADLFQDLDVAGWIDLVDGFRIAAKAITSMFDPEVESLDTGFSAQAIEPRTEFFPRRALYYMLRDTETGFVRRGRLGDNGRFPGTIFRANTTYAAAYFDPKNGAVGSAFFTTAAAGQFTAIPTARLVPVMPGQPDADGDGLPDSIEQLVGTNPDSNDTDGDGVLDGLEIQADTNPLDGLTVQLGLATSIQLPTRPIRLRAENDVAVLVDATTNLMIIDVKDPLQPVILSRASIAAGFNGTFALTWPYALVGGDSAALFDLSDPATPVRKWTRNERTTGGAIAFGRVYICNDQSVLAFDLETGEPVPTITGVQGFYRNMRILGDQLVATAGSTLEIFKLSEGGNRLQSIGKITEKPWDGFFVEPGYAYVGWDNGYYVIDIRVPEKPVIAARPGSRAVFSHRIIKDSGNRLISLTRAGAGLGENLASIYDQSSPAVATNFLTSLPTSASPVDLFIYRGRLLAAGEGFVNGTLEVFNYREPDFGTNPPSIQLRSYTFSNNPPIEQSAGWFRLAAIAQDDVVVRNVEFYVDGTLAFDDGSHPFEADLRAPDFSSQKKTNFTVRARAFDLAGRSTWSETITVGLTNELREPRLVSFTPAPNSLGLTGTVFEVSARFTESILASSLNSGLLVTAAGPDEQFETADDRAVPFTTTLLSANLHGIELNQPLAAGYYRVAATTNLTDLFGNRLANPTNWILGVREPLLWVGGNGNWDDPAHWNKGRIPSANDFVRIEPPGQAEVSLITAASERFFAYEISSAEPVFFLDRPILELGHEAVFRAPVTLGRIGGQGAAILSGGRSTYQGGIEINGHLNLWDHTLVIDSPGIPIQIGNYSIELNPFVQQLGSQFIIERGTTVSVLKTDDLSYPWIATKPNDQFINRGVIRKLGRGAHPFQGKFRNEGTLLIEEGTLRTEALYPGFENLGTIEIRPGATFLGQGGGRGTPAYHGRTARFTGTGTNRVAESVNLDCEYTFEGTTILEGDLVEFRGGVRNTGAWQAVGNPAIIRGLFADFAGPVTLGNTNGTRGGFRFQTSGDAVLRDLAVLRGELLGQSVVRVLSPMTVSNSFRLASSAFDGLLTVRFETDFRSQGRLENDNYFQAGDARVEFAREVHWAFGPIELTTNCVILPGATFFAESPTGTTNVVIPRFAARAGLANEGTYKQNGAGTNRIQTLLNSGLVDISAGVLSCSALSQTAGELRLHGGSIEALAGDNLGQIDVLGGTVSGNGTISGNLWVAGGTLKPGLPLGTLNINENLNLRANGALVVDVGGIAPGISHDQVRVLAEADFRGRLEINLLSGFTPELGQEFTIATFDFLRTKFPEVIGQNIGGGKKFELIYSSQSLLLRVVPAL